MSKRVFIVAVVAHMLLLAACGSPLSGAGEQQPLPSPASEWTISLTQSGGFAGVMLNITVSSNGKLTAENQRAGRSVTQNVTSETLARLAALSSAVTAPTAGSPHSGCADCFLYDLKIDSGGRSIQLQADDTTLADSGAQVAFVSNQAQAAKVESIRSELPALKEVLTFDEDWPKLLAGSKEAALGARFGDLVKPSDVATLIYT
jgi:hypothetical protein